MLTAIEVKNAKPGRHADGRGLYLMVRPSGSRSWVVRAQKDGKRRDFGIGSASTVSLAQARAMAAELRERFKMTMTKVLRDLGFEKVTVHGFCSSFTDGLRRRRDFRKRWWTKPWPTSSSIGSRLHTTGPASLSGGVG